MGGADGMGFVKFLDTIENNRIIIMGLFGVLLCDFHRDFIELLIKDTILLPNKLVHPKQSWQPIQEEQKYNHDNSYNPRNKKQRNTRYNWRIGMIRDSLCQNTYQDNLLTVRLILQNIVFTHSTIKA